MKAILFTVAELGGITARSDKSLRFSVLTGELSDHERAAFFKLQGTNASILIQPDGCDDKTPLALKTSNKGKSPSQQMRSLLFLIWKEAGSQGEFETYYTDRVRRMCRSLSDELEEMDK